MISTININKLYLEIKKSNVEVLETAKSKQTLLRTIQYRKLQYFGHLIRRKGKQKLLMEGKLEGTRRRGKQRMTCTCDVRNSRLYNAYSTNFIEHSSRILPKWEHIFIKTMLSTKYL